MSFGKWILDYDLKFSSNIISQVFVDFQAAERERLKEPPSDIGLEPLCALVCEYNNIAYKSKII